MKNPLVSTLVDSTQWRKEPMNMKIDQQKLLNVKHKAKKEKIE